MKDYLYIDDRQLRVEINMNTVEAWENMSGKSLSQFESEAATSSGKGGVSTISMLMWLYCAVKEGEELEEKAFELDFAGFKKIVKPATIVRFTPIFLKQYLGNSSKIAVKNEVKIKKSLWFRLQNLFKSHKSK